MQFPVWKFLAEAWHKAVRRPCAHSKHRGALRSPSKLRITGITKMPRVMWPYLQTSLLLWTRSFKFQVVVLILKSSIPPAKRKKRRWLKGLPASRKPLVLNRTLSHRQQKITNGFLKCIGVWFPTLNPWQSLFFAVTPSTEGCDCTDTCTMNVQG